jgi:hypothetical protein
MAGAGFLGPFVGLLYQLLLAAALLWWHGRVGVLAAGAGWAASVVAVLAQRAYAHGVLRAPPVVDKAVAVASRWAAAAGAAIAAHDAWVFPGCVAAGMVLLALLVRAPPPPALLLPLPLPPGGVPAVPPTAATARLYGLAHWHLDCRRLSGPAPAPLTLCVLVDMATGAAVAEQLQMPKGGSRQPPATALVEVAATLGRPWARGGDAWPALLSLSGTPEAAAHPVPMAPFPAVVVSSRPPPAVVAAAAAARSTKGA